MTRHLTALLLLAGLATVFATLALDYRPSETLNVSATYYAERTAPDLGAQNIVTAIIVTYRGLDTLGEVTVLFLTAAIVGLILMTSQAKAQDRAKEQDQAHLFSPSGELLQTGTRLLVPLILLSGVYVFVNGHLTPGGGFQGGAILASATLLLLLSNPMRRFSHRVIAIVESLSGLSYVLIGVLGLVLAGGFLDNRILPLGEFGALLSAGAMPLVYSLIGLKVGAEFSSMLASLSETEKRQ